MKKIIATAVLSIIAVIIPTTAAHALSSELMVTKDGQATMSSAKVIQVAGGTLFARLYWGDAFIRFTIKTGKDTKFYRATGEATTIAEVKEGDILDTVGTLETGTNTLSLVATSVKNTSVQKEQSVLSGTVTSIDLSQRQFTMTTKDQGSVVVKVDITTPFQKGTRTLDIGSLKIGDRISKTAGDFDLAAKILAAQSVVVYVDMSKYKAQNFAGKLVETPIIASDGSATLKVAINNITYTVLLKSDAIVMRANKSSATLKRYIAGDSIRLYGVMREVDDPIIDAEVIRNLSL